ncbi:SdpI family protein [Petralouisia muris]|uniref:SdpI family protein n=1 Tax=Petralouisia muris TaxID=3032872 RepID=A0AC61RPH5_9FIRM|nr:SdpI family protein [Petralouisia muris]TGY88733.1 SdpI family protein [Petralouisia muris]
MLIFTIIMSLTMLGMGLYLGKGGPKEINKCLGYRSKRAMSSQESWEFAQKEAGKIYKIFALVNLLLFSIIFMLIKGKENYNDIFLICAYIEIALLIVPIPVVEIKLKRFLNKK